MNPTSYDFIDLQRTFYEMSDSNIENYEVYFNRAFSIGNHLRWPDLIKEYRVIILSEAGAGKTAEILNITSALRKQGKPAFFIRLEHIPGDFEDAFEIGTFEGFQEWLASGEEGWLFLDSVDEARLRDPGDFELAIRKLGRLINKAVDRTHIVITGRTTAWRPMMDLALCTNHLPYAASSSTEHSSFPEDNDPTGSIQTETVKQGKTLPVFKIVALDNLTSDQVAIYVKARGVQDNIAFLEGVERADAWAFTSRPQDLEELIGFWIKNGRIGTRLEIMQNSIDLRLVERDPGRAFTQPLSVERARRGSRLLAAATTLAKDPTIRVPDGAVNSKGIAVRSVLCDWDEKDQSTLLSRPIFDEAIYSTVRFHQRSVREYLTAEWFVELLMHQASRRSIEILFFHNQYGLDIVVPTLRPILPWLAIMDEKIRERVLEIAPEIIFEGGDPSQLPLDVRRNILYKVCEQIASGAENYSIHDYAAVQRFASPDLTNDLHALFRQYTGNDELTTFLLRMVWIGQITGVLPEVMEIALKPTAKLYERTVSFRAINAIGDIKDKDRVCQCFLAEASELNRDLLAELLEGVEPTDKSLAWLLACLEKCEPKEPYTVDHLPDNITKYIESADIELLPQLIVGMNNLLSLPPFIERRLCEVSEKYQWLIVPACKAVERMILDRHPKSLEQDPLAILRIFSAMKGYGSHDLIDVKTDFSMLVRNWKELNQALFWFEVQRSREAVDRKRGERLTNFRQASPLGSFWGFEGDDFEYAVNEIFHQAQIDDKLIALSLAFNLYKGANRPRSWRAKLKKAVAGNNELSERLGIYLKPPAQSRVDRTWKQQEAKMRRREKAYREKQEKYHTDWKKYLRDDLAKIKEVIIKNPGKITNPMLYLYDQLREEKTTSSRWTEYNWKLLIPEYGDEIARFYRDSTVSYWRHYNPKLKSEGAPLDKTPIDVIIGLTGIEIEAIEIKDWPKNLINSEAKRACKYASFELNGFPTWFPKLFEAYPTIVCDFLMREIRYELSIEKTETDTHYIISDISWSGQWAWNQLAPSIYKLLSKTEPQNLSNLDNLLKVLQGSSLTDDLIEEMTTRKCQSIKKLDHVARWFAVWTGVNPKAAIASLRTRIRKVKAQEKRTLFAMNFITNLLGGRNYLTAVRDAFKTPEYLKELYILMHEHIRRSEDINRVGTGVYSPGLRDHAQDARNSLLELLNQIPGKESFLALMDIAQIHPEEASRPFIMRHAKIKAEKDGDIKPWLPSQVRDFNEKLERTPSNHRELAELAILRLLDLKDDLENGDSSIAKILRTVTLEPDMRKYLGRDLREKAFGRYSIPQEEELADGKKPDLRFHGMGFDGPVPAELKLADNWTGPSLFERLENQLCGDYLRDKHSGCGIFVLVYRGDKTTWELPCGSRVDFAGLTAALQEHWRQISQGFKNIEEIWVIGIDLTMR